MMNQDKLRQSINVMIKKSDAYVLFSKNVVSLRRASAGSGVQTLLETRDIGSLPGYLKPPNLQAPQAGRQCPCI